MFQSDIKSLGGKGVCQADNSWYFFLLSTTEFGVTRPWRQSWWGKKLRSKLTRLGCAMKASPMPSNFWKEDRQLARRCSWGPFTPTLWRMRGFMAGIGNEATHRSTCKSPLNCLNFASSSCSMTHDMNVAKATASVSVLLWPHGFKLEIFELCVIRNPGCSSADQDAGIAGSFETSVVNQK